MGVKHKVKEKLKNQFFPIPQELKKNHLYPSKEQMKELENRFGQTFTLDGEAKINSPQKLTKLIYRHI
jgi:hypothetical protein